MRWLIFGMLIYSGIIAADVPKNVSVSYQNGSVVVDYSGLSEDKTITSIEVTRCISAPNEYNPNVKIRTGCVEGEKIDTIQDDVEKSISFSQKGLFKVSLIDRCLFCVGNLKVAYTHWEQFVVNLDRAGEGSQLENAIEKYAPVYSYFDGEQYYPFHVDNLFTRPASDYEYEELRYNLDKYRFDDNDTVGDVLKQNGYSGNLIRLKRDVATSTVTLRGDSRNAAIYWYIDKKTEQEVWVTYFGLFAFDRKLPQYFSSFGEQSLSFLGNHEIDRESISILFRFNSEEDEWLPETVVYSGHLESQPTTFLGCGDSRACNTSGTLAGISWDNGKTSVDWDNVARTDNRPIVYVAHSSHAMKPGYGFFRIDAEGTLTEPAGSPNRGNITYPDIIEMDLSEPKHLALTYSGFMIKAAAKNAELSSWYRIFPFVRYPTEAWVRNSNNTFDKCVENGQGCQDYIHRDCGDEHPQQRAVQARAVVVQQCGGFLANAAQLELFNEINASNYMDVVELHTYFGQRDYAIDQINYISSFEDEILSGISTQFFPLQSSGSTDVFRCSGGGQVSVNSVTSTNQTVLTVAYENCTAGSSYFHGTYEKSTVPEGSIYDAGTAYNFEMLLTIDEQRNMKALDSRYLFLNGDADPADYRIDIFGDYYEFTDNRNAYRITSKEISGTGFVESLDEELQTTRGGRLFMRQHNSNINLAQITYETDFLTARAFNQDTDPDIKTLRYLVSYSAFFETDNRSDSFASGALRAGHFGINSTELTGVRVVIGDGNENREELEDGIGRVWLYRNFEDNFAAIRNSEINDGIFLEDIAWPENLYTFTPKPLRAATSQRNTANILGY